MFGRTSRLLAIAVASWLLSPLGTCHAQATTAVTKKIAKLLEPTVVLVRVSIVSRDEQGLAKPTNTAAKQTAPKQAVAPGQVVVCSGVLLGKGMIVSPVYAASDTPIRVTLPGGEQVRGQVRVIDEYSGLSLIRCKSPTPMGGLEIETTLPEVGSMVASAAAWGRQKPVVSFGYVSGLRRSITNVHFPPLLQCDIRTVGTSSGAALVNAKGKLVGIVVFSQVNRTRGWTYCVPARHVQRLLRAQPKDTRGDNVVVIKRRRPIVGMVLDDNGSGIRVSRVGPKSPASKAGIKVGDHVLAVDGLKIRSVYQAVLPNINKQPGDVTEFLIRQNNTQRTVKVVLGGDVELPSAPFENLGSLVSPRMRIWNRNGRYFLFQNPAPNGVLRRNTPRAKAFTSVRGRTLSREEEIARLKRAVALYAKLVANQEQTIKELKKNQDFLESQIKQFQTELKRVTKAPAPKKN